MQARRDPAVDWLATRVKLTLLDRRLLAAAAVVVPTIAVLALVLPANPAVGAVARWFIAPPSLGAPFLGGLFARRGGAVTGLLMGIWAALVVPVLVVAIPAYRAPVTLAALLLVPVVGVVLGAVGALTRRVLESLAGLWQRGSVS